VTALRAIGLAAVLAVLLWPEAARWSSEYTLRDVTSRFRDLARAPRSQETTRALDDVTIRARVAAAAVPGDQRGVILAGSAQLLAAKPAQALATYGDAQALGERAEIDLDLARAHALLGDVPAAEAALLRMAWVSPPLLERLNAETRARVGAQVTKREAALSDGTLTAPPPLP
jgi:hypothetical protein